MRLFFAPEYPEKIPYALAVIIHHLDYLVTLSPRENFDAAVLWEDETFLHVPPILQEIQKTKPVINIDCIDISKNRVEQALGDIFGLSTFIDPLTFEGKCVKKPDANSVRHGFVITCPQPKAEDDWVYQRLIETRQNGFQIEYRTPVILGEIPLVYVSERDFPTNDIRDCKRHKLTPTPTNQVYTPDEVAKILAFCKDIGMDMGELDIMRSTDDGNIYIIDANKTAAGFGPENRANWSPGDSKRVIAILAETFERRLTTLIKDYRP
jgi:hypothetical protein